MCPFIAILSWKLKTQSKAWHFPRTKLRARFLLFFLLLFSCSAQSAQNISTRSQPSPEIIRDLTQRVAQSFRNQGIPSSLVFRTGTVEIWSYYDDVDPPWDLHIERLHGAGSLRTWMTILERETVCSDPANCRYDGLHVPTESDDWVCDNTCCRVPIPQVRLRWVALTGLCFESISDQLVLQRIEILRD